MLNYGPGQDLDALATMLFKAAALGKNWTQLRRCLAAMNGHFALILKTPEICVAAVDRVRSVPLFFAHDGASPIVSSSAGELVGLLDLGPGDADPVAGLCIGMAGYTIGLDTLYPTLQQIGPGEAVVFDPSRRDPQRVSYALHRPWRMVEKPARQLHRSLVVATEEIFENLANSADGRTVAVPLSGGLDSRLIAAGLRRVGYQNVKCFSYGKPGNFEAVTASNVAEKLGYPWLFISTTHSVRRRNFQSEVFADYLKFADSYCSIPTHQEITALRDLLKSGFVDKSAIVVNGQTGDYLSGKHIHPSLAERDEPFGAEAGREAVLDCLIAKHFSLWGLLKTPANLKRIRHRLAKYLESIGASFDQPHEFRGAYEASEFADRQCKYVINAQRQYEFFGMEWRLPLWDRPYLEFWQAAPPAAKSGQRLYRQMLEQENWGGVWRDIPDRRFIRPASLAALRKGLKLLNAPIGRAHWHAFERRYLDYWMQGTSSYSRFPYREIVRDRRGFRSAVSWHAERYLRDKNLGLDGRPIDAGEYD